MKVARRYLFWIITIAIYLHAGSIQGSEWKDKGEAEGKLTWYASLSATDARRIIDRFKELYPKIDAQFYRAGDAQLMERILNEARAGKFDWDVVSTTGFYAYTLKKRGMLAPYDSPERKFIRAGHKDSQAMWTSIYTNYTVLGYNSRLVAKDNLPKSHADLLKPFWKGQVGVVQTGYEWFAVMLQGMGQQKGMAFMSRSPSSSHSCATAGHCWLSWWLLERLTQHWQRIRKTSKILNATARRWTGRH